MVYLSVDIGISEPALNVKHVFAMKKINWWRVFFFLCMAGMVVLESCAIFKPKCDCPKW